MKNPHALAAAEYDRSFREIVLVLGGIFASTGCDDTLVRQVATSLGRVYDRARARLREHGTAEEQVPGRRGQPHPAIASLLARIGG